MEKVALEKRMLSRADAARYCGISDSYLAKRAVYGGGPRYAKIGRRCGYDVADLDAWISAQKVGSTAENKS